jgi:hypothetical protein
MSFCFCAVEKVEPSERTHPYGVAHITALSPALIPVMRAKTLHIIALGSGAIHSFSFFLILERLATTYQSSAAMRRHVAPNDKLEMPYSWHNGKECEAFSAIS